jgi:hypothetical protein
MFSAENSRILKTWGYASGHFSVPPISVWHACCFREITSGAKWKEGAPTRACARAHYLWFPSLAFTICVLFPAVPSCLHISKTEQCKQNSCRFRWSRGLNFGSTISQLVGLQFRTPPVAGMSSLVSVILCQVQASATARSLVQRDSTVEVGGKGNARVCVSLSVIRYKNYPLHPQWEVRKKENKKSNIHFSFAYKWNVIQ